MNSSLMEELGEVAEHKRGKKLDECRIGRARGCTPFRMHIVEIRQERIDARLELVVVNPRELCA